MKEKRVQPHYLSADDRVNNALKESLGSLRGEMLDAAESIRIPERFYVYPDSETPSMWIGDSWTGNEVKVGLFAYREVREVLNDVGTKSLKEILDDVPLFAAKEVRKVLEAMF
jgi:hypothetical protein